MPVLQNESSRRAGIINKLMENWRQPYPTFEEQKALTCISLPYTNIRAAQYGWKESLPFPTKWPYGMPRTYRTIRDRHITIQLMPFQVAIPYNIYDKEDDQLGDMDTHVSMVVERFKMLPDQMVAEYLNNALGTNPLNDAIETAYDGVNVFSATDGDGNNRFGISGGNIVTGSGVSAAAIMHDMAVVQRRFLQFKDTENQPIFNEATVQYSRLHAIIPNTLNEVFQRITKQEMIRGDAGSITAESNYLKGEFKYHLNPYLTDSSDYFVVVEHKYWKPFAFREPGGSGLRQIFADRSNSDRARDLNEEALLADVRNGMRPWFPATIVKVNN